ncbi:MAG: Smr/MutS family protein [Firmicutes bacterium]|nr:Smr/MutS family protein [Bacillota bacterium]
MEKRSAPGVAELDLHGKNVYQARIALEAALRRADGGVYRLRVIHGWHGGDALRALVREEFAAHPKVLRLEERGAGATELVLREY